ncbi:uncharacterized protein LOC115620736 [Scaptodrosophila lebanonensis]|uniref:Uncharacterized protein LOC115620736 n=1 Tax=Drosophila lebanonensis TaxID=7225 RepID=A0A6J2T401_DROLE|nr:uncharacterized protein LOC115620736 [Scaptodrosophila lebanonensis]
MKPSKGRKELWYSLNELLGETYCPSCGRQMDRFKMPLAHAKRCFSIKKVGPIYRLHGYVECKCGLLIADNTKAKKLHLCLGEVPAFEPDLTYVHKRPLSPEPQTDEQPPIKPVKSLERELLQPKPWIRNFVTPLQLASVKANIKPKPPRVRNFDMALPTQEPQDVWIYSITHGNDENSEDGLSEWMLHTEEEPVVRLRKRMAKLPRSATSDN